MFYIMNSSEEEDQQAASDACRLIDAWEIRQDKKRFRRATDFIKAQSSLFNSLARLQEAELSDPF